MKKRRKALFSALLAAVLTVCALFPLRSFAANLPCEAWEGNFEAIIPLGEAPWAKVRLTPKGTEFTEWYIPEYYEVVFKDGSSIIVSSENRKERSVDGVEGRDPMVGFAFDAQINGETFTFITKIQYYERAQQCVFEAGHEGAAIDENGQTRAFTHYVGGGECDTTVDKGNAFNYIAHKMDRLFWDIRSFFVDLYHRDR